MSQVHPAASRAVQGDDPLAGLKAAFLDGAVRHIRELEGLVQILRDRPVLWPDCRRRLYAIAHIVTGQGSSFGYPLATRIGESLSRLTRRESDVGAVPLELVAAHVVALRTVIDQGIEGDGGDLGETLVGRLEALVVSALAD